MKKSLLMCGVLAVSACEGPPTATSVQAIESGDLVTVERASIPLWLEKRESRALTDLETAFSYGLRASYLSPVATPEGHQRIARAALVQWAHIVRQRLPDALHTKVPGLVEDPECSGSVIGDAPLLDYVDRVGRAEGTSGTSNLIASLDVLARNIACLGPRQTEQLATAMAIAFDDMRATLVANGLDSVIPYIVQALSAPMVLVHEVERQHGTAAPLADWFRDHEAILSEGARNQRHPASWHGLWLYDRMTGRLRGFRATKKASDENQVELQAFFHTLARPTAEDFRCSFAEMVQRGPSQGRYACNGVLCRDADDPRCLTPSGGDTAPEHGGGVSIPGIATSTTIACIAAAATTQTEEQMACIVEATGLSADPRARLTKELQRVTLAGIKVGGACTLSSGAGDAAYNQALRAAREAYDKAIDAQVAAMTKAIEDLKAAQQNYNNVMNDPTSTSYAQDTAETKLDAAVAKVNDEQTKLAEITLKEAEKRDKAIRAAEDARRVTAAGSGSGSGSATAHCVDQDNCGNGCSALAAQAQQALDCVREPADPKQTDPMTGPGGCGLACDPVDPAEGTGLTCVETLTVDGGSRLSEACWAVRCGPTASSMSTSECCGRDGITASGEPELAGMCGNVHCEDGAPSYVNGQCSCGDSASTLPGTVLLPDVGGGFAPFPR